MLVPVLGSVTVTVRLLCIILSLGCHSNLQDSDWWPQGSTFWGGGYDDHWCQSHCRDLRKCPQFQLHCCKLQCKCWLWSPWGGTSFWWCWLGRRRSHQWPQGQNLSKLNILFEKHRLCTSLVSYYSGYIVIWNSEWCLLLESNVCFSSAWVPSGIPRTWLHVGHLYCRPQNSRCFCWRDWPLADLARMFHVIINL